MSPRHALYQFRCLVWLVPAAVFVQFAIAWCASAFLDPSDYGPNGSVKTPGRRVHVMERAVGPLSCFQCSLRGWWDETDDARLVKVARSLPADSWNDDVEEVYQIRAGWPMHVLSGEIGYASPQYSLWRTCKTWNFLAIADPVSSISIKGLPMRVDIWGAVINTAFWTVPTFVACKTFALLFAVFGSVHRQRRYDSMRCVYCDYDLEILLPKSDCKCPECGKQAVRFSPLLQAMWPALSHPLTHIAVAIFLWQFVFVAAVASQWSDSLKFRILCGGLAAGMYLLGYYRSKWVFLPYIALLFAGLVYYVSISDYFMSKWPGETFMLFLLALGIPIPFWLGSLHRRIAFEAFWTVQRSQCDNLGDQDSESDNR